MLRLPCRDTIPATDSEASEADKASKSTAGASEAATAPQESTAGAPRALQTSLVAQRLGICLSTQRTRTGSIPGLGRYHVPLHNQARGLQLPSLCSRVCACNERSHHNEKSVQHNEPV